MKLPSSPANSLASRAPRPWIIAGAILASALGAWLFPHDVDHDGLAAGIASATAKPESQQAMEKAEPPATAPISPLWHTPPPRTFETVRERVVAGVGESVTESGYAIAATETVRNDAGSPEEQRIALEAIMSGWSAKDRPAAAAWMAQHAGHINTTAETLDHGLWDAALGGYIEGVVRNDPDSAVIGAGLLEPQTPLPIENAQNRTLLPDVPDTVSGNQGPAGIPEAVIGGATPPANSVDGGGTTVTSTDGVPASERKRLFPGDPGFPGDPDFLSPLR